jgi:hypothetical protein
MLAVNGVGEPCAGEPHARFEVAGAGNGTQQCHRASPRPYSRNVTVRSLSVLFCRSQGYDSVSGKVT